MKRLLTSCALVPLTLLPLNLSAQEKITYADHVRPLLENKCFSCHNPDKKKGDLDLTSFAATMTGGGSGSVISAGDAEGSKLVTCVTKKAEPYMPPEGSALGAKDIEILTKWISGGVLETASSIAKKSAPKANLTLTSVGKGKPEGPPAVPENVLLEPVVVAPRTTAITALASSPWAPLVAVSGQRQALIYDTNTKVLAGIYPYPEGYIRSLKFSQNGSLLIAGGGRGGKNGNAVAWDVKSGKRITEVGKEFDQVMSADITANHSMIAIGSPSKKVKVYNASTGEELYVIKKHTEWVLAVAFSPDGVLLASADRNGNVMVSEAANGGEFFTLDGHKAACTSLAWRADGNILASCAEDGKVSLWEMENGKLVKSWDAHGGGVLSVNFTPDGQVVTAGRDGTVKIWDINGTKKKETKSAGDLITKVAGLFDSKVVASGDWQGNVKLWNIDTMEELGVLSSNPGPIAQRIVESEKRATELVAQVAACEAEIKKSDDGVKAVEAKIAEAKKNEEGEKGYRSKLEGEVNAMPGKLEAMKKVISEAQAKRTAQVEVIKKHEQSIAQAKQIEAELPKQDAELIKLTTEAGKLTAPDQAPKKAEADQKVAQKKSEIDGKKAQLDGLKKAIATAPQPLADFDKQIKEATASMTALSAEKPKKEKELADLKKRMEGWGATYAELDKQLAAAKGALPNNQKKLADQKTLLAFTQKYPTFLKAAQFNVGVLSDKEKLAKIEADVTGYKEAIKDAEAAKVEAAARIEASKKAIAEAKASQPGKEAEFVRLSGELPAVEKILDPTKAQEGQIAGQLDAEQKKLAAKEAEAAAVAKEKTDRTAAAQKAVTDITAQIAVLQKQLGEVSGKADQPIKNADSKKAEFVKAEADLNAAKLQQTAAEQEAAKKVAELKTKDAAHIAASQAHDGAGKVLTPMLQQKQKLTTELGQKKGVVEQKEKDLAAASQANKQDQVLALQKALDEARTAFGAAEKSLAEMTAKVADAEKEVQGKLVARNLAKTELDQANASNAATKNALTAATNNTTGKQSAFTRLKQESENLEKVAGPMRNQKQALVAQIDKSKQTLTEKQAEPANAEKDFGSKNAPIQAEITKIKAVIEPINKQLAEVRAKLEADTKIVVAKREEVGKAQALVDAAKKAQIDGQKTIESSEKEIVEKGKSLVDIKGELAKIEPQLQPQRDKVKQLMDQYLAMLPK